MPLLALLNNLIEIRTDFLKMIVLARRCVLRRRGRSYSPDKAATKLPRLALPCRSVKAEDSVTGIGPWGGAMRSLAFCAVGVNLGYLGLTSGFFEQLSHYVPIFRDTHARVISIVLAEHLLLALRVVVDWVRLHSPPAMPFCSPMRSAWNVN